MRRTMIVLASVMAVVLTGCSGSAAPSAKTSPSSSPTSRDLVLVGLGDSIPGALGCEAPCRSYVDVYGELAATALGKPVAVRNLGSNASMTASTLITYLQGDDETKSAVAGASLITLTVGTNDWMGPCHFTGMADCLHQNAAVTADNVGLVLDEIAKLRRGAPTSVRVTDYYDMGLGDPHAPEAWGFDKATETKAFEQTLSAALTEFDGLLCRTATAKGAVCVDLRTPFNGPAHRQDAARLLQPDHIHPNQAGHELIAATLARAGFAPLS